MKLSQLSNQELNLKMQNLVKKEREVLSEIILHIQEVQRRKLFLQIKKIYSPNLTEEARILFATKESSLKNVESSL